MRFKDSNEMRSVIGSHCTRTIGYGFCQYVCDSTDLEFLLITRDARGEELQDYEWSLNWQAVEWLVSKGVKVERVKGALQVAVFHQLLNHNWEEAEHLIRCWADIQCYDQVIYSSPSGDWRRQVTTSTMHYLDGNVLLGSEQVSSQYGSTDWVTDRFKIA